MRVVTVCEIARSTANRPNTRRIDSGQFLSAEAVQLCTHSHVQHRSIVRNVSLVIHTNYPHYALKLRLLNEKQILKKKKKIISIGEIIY